MTCTQEKNDPFSIADAARAMREKYAELAALRQHARDGTLPDPRPRLRALAARFPGALRELDQLTDDELRARVAALGRPDVASRPPPWLEPVARYHAALSRALATPTRGQRPSTRALAEVAAELGLDLAATRALVRPTRPAARRP
ncbi:MAG: hypothetical protein IT374_22470 [Polyangiaceae bacterium]|nr:hypothetical protein [Polyangiaceae bacterium]